MQDIGKRYSVKNVKTFTAEYGDEGPGWTATIYRDGVRVGTARYGGTGGPTDVEVADPAVLAEMDAVGRERYNADCDEKGYEHLKAAAGEHLADILVGDLVADFLTQRDRQRFLRKATRQVVFILDGDDPEYSYRQFPARVPRERAIAELAKPKYASKHPRVLNGATGAYEAL